MSLASWGTLLTHKQCIQMRCSNSNKCSVTVLTAHACSVAVHCSRVLLVLCLAETDACYLAAVASQSQKSIPDSALHDQCLPGSTTRALQHLLQQKARHLAALRRWRHPGNANLYRGAHAHRNASMLCRDSHSTCMLRDVESVCIGSGAL